MVSNSGSWLGYSLKDTAALLVATLAIAVSGVDGAQLVAYALP